MLPEHPESLRPSREKISPRPLRLLELPVVDGVPNVSVNTSGIDLVSIDLSARELRDEHRGIHRGLLPSEIAELFEEPALHGFS
jgi:hypothetical protein